MSWTFDQARNVACVTCAPVLAGEPVLVVTHYEDDHSWAFMDGRTFHPENAMLVAMSEVVDVHPELFDIAYLEPGWTATRLAIGEPWLKSRDRWDDETSRV